MKRLHICVILFLSLLLFSGAVYVKVETRLNEIRAEVEKISDAFENGDTDAAKKYSTSAMTKWENFMKRQYLLMDKEHMTEITMLLSQIDSGIYEKDTEVISECETLLRFLDVFRSKQKRLL